MQFALLHSHRNSPSSLPNSLRTSKIRSFTARMSTEWRDGSCWFTVPLGGRGGFLLQGRKLFSRALDNPLQVRQEVSIHGIPTRVEGLDCLLPRSDQDREQGLLLAVIARLDPRRLPPIRQLNARPALCHEPSRGGQAARSLAEQENACGRDAAGGPGARKSIRSSRGRSSRRSQRRSGHGTD
jgi:hypothetical protein